MFDSLLTKTLNYQQVNQNFYVWGNFDRYAMEVLKKCFVTTDWRCIGVLINFGMFISVVSCCIIGDITTFNSFLRT